MTNDELFELDEEQFKVQPVNHDNEGDCDGMCCSDCTVSDCPCAKPWNQITFEDRM